MKRTRTISLILLPTLLVPITACDEPDRMYCVDDAGIAVDESKCLQEDEAEMDGGVDGGDGGDALDAGATDASTPHHHHSHSRGFIWMYVGGGHTTVFQHGTRVTGGTTVPNPARSYVAPHQSHITYHPNSGYRTPGSYRASPSFRSSPSVRGGFGGTGRSMGGGRGGSVS